jgi:hypothetical protein
MNQSKRALSWPSIIGIWLIAIAASLAASYLVQRFLLEKPNPEHKIAIIVGSTVPLLVLLSSRRRKT